MTLGSNFLGKTVLLVDCSPSMNDKISGKSDLSRKDTAIALAILLRELCEEVKIIGFSTVQYDIKPRRGFALRDEFNKVPSAGTYIGAAISYAQKEGFDRMICITDEQSSDRPPKAEGLSYIINVAAYLNGVGFGDYVTISGWSEAIIDYIQEYERSDENDD